MLKVNVKTDELQYSNDQVTIVYVEFNNSRSGKRAMENYIGRATDWVLIEQYEVKSDFKKTDHILTSKEHSFHSLCQGQVLFTKNKALV